MNTNTETDTNPNTQREASAEAPFPRWLHLCLQPLLLIAAGAVWYNYHDDAIAYLGILVAVQLLLGLLETWRPARPNWRQPVAEKLTNITIVAVIYVFSVSVVVMYNDLLSTPLIALRERLGMDIWPSDWPIFAQLLMVFFLSELMWYWIHRAEHRWHFVWRVSGHGSHHSFKHLNAINFGANHPLETFLLVLPSAFIELFFGVGAAAAGATILLGIQASIAHANLDLNTRWIGAVFTTNHYHLHHHSIVLEESNTNYGCAAIIWDRLFGTFSPGEVIEAGTGPTEPALWEKILMPVREPRDTTIAPEV